MERSVILRHRATGLFLGSPAGVTEDAGTALRFPTPGAAHQFLARHACEPGTLEVVEAGHSAAA